MRIVSIVGARPNFVKLAPLCWEFAQHSSIEHLIVHTGQHYDDSLSCSFFETFRLPKPAINLNIGSSSHGVQTGRIMASLDPVLERIRPDWVLTLGDVNSTVAASLVAVKMGLKTAHVEAGLRSFDRTMPEEINRIVTDSISDLLFVTDSSGEENLLHEGVDPNRIRMVGNIMIDVLINMLPQALAIEKWLNFGIIAKPYLVATFHRPSNVDNPERLQLLVEIIQAASVQWPVILPLHPRTCASLEKFNIMQILNAVPGAIIITPQDYISFISLVTQAMAVITDSGGIQAETTWLGIPCLTLRDNTEWPITLTIGTNELVPMNKFKVLEKLHRVASGEWKSSSRPPLWDGLTARRVAEALNA